MDEKIQNSGDFYVDMKRNPSNMLEALTFFKDQIYLKNLIMSA